MTRQELIDLLDGLLEQDHRLSTVVYAVIKNTYEIKKLAIIANAIDDVQAIFCNSINHLIIDKEDQGLINVSTADDRSNTIFEYDLELPAGLAFFGNQLNDQLPIFDSRTDDFSDIEYLIIEIGTAENQLKLLKKLSPIEVFGKGGFSLWPTRENAQRIEKFEDKVLRISPSFNALYINDTYIFMNMTLLEKSHGFHDVIIREATSSIERIGQIELLETSDGLIDMLKNISFARRVVKVRNSPVLTRKISNEKIIEFTRRHPSLINKMKYSEDGTKLILHTNIAKELFIKMLDDAYLISELTEQNYESKAKDAVTILLVEE